MISYGSQKLPFEACGIIASSDGKHIDTFIDIVNDHPHPLASFNFQPQSWIDAHYRLQRDGGQLIGYMHTHPEEEAILSQADRDGFDGSNELLVCIISYKQKDRPQIRMFQKLPTNQFIDYPLILT